MATAFSVAGLSLWNSLDLFVKQSSSVTVFQTKLKTYLFEKAFKVSKVESVVFPVKTLVKRKVCLTVLD